MPTTMPVGRVLQRLSLETLSLRRQLIGERIAHCRTLDAIDQRAVEDGAHALRRINVRAVGLAELQAEFDRLEGEMMGMDVMPTKEVILG
jgi:hypothetical protein